MICGKHAFVVGQWFCMARVRVIAQAISLEKFHGYQSIHENRETSPPQIISNIYGILDMYIYIVLYSLRQKKFCNFYGFLKFNS